MRGKIVCDRKNIRRNEKMSDRYTSIGSIMMRINLYLLDTATYSICPPLVVNRL